MYVLVTSHDEVVHPHTMGEGHGEGEEEDELRGESHHAILPWGMSTYSSSARGHLRVEINAGQLHELEKGDEGLGKLVAPTPASRW